ncbi:MAG: substrate-binding domain-containing protein [Chitinophagales bacterium]|nr:substrate-binding domain-containing protein [Chitinophagales bacterium]
MMSKRTNAQAPLSLGEGAGVRQLLTAVFLFSILFLSSCKQGNAPTDNPTSGHIKISVDETFYPFFDAEIAVFHSIYRFAVINAAYVSEGQAVKDLLADSTKLIVISRELNADEMKYFEEQKLFPKALKIATDAIALVTHPENKDTALTMQQLELLFTGKADNWNLLDAQNDPLEIRVIFDNTNSSTARFIKEKFNTELPAYCFAANNNAEVVKYVAEHKNALGVIGVNWISDSDDSTSIDFMDKVNVLRIISDSSDTRGKQPYQAYIAQGSYPLTRNIYMVSSEARSGLATGLTAFVASDPGQRIILKAGLVPATMPVRILGFGNY